MNIIGYFLIICSFLGGTFLTSLNATKVNWFAFLPIIIAGFVGLALVKQQQKRLAQSDHKLEDDLKIMQSSLEQIVGHLSELNAHKRDLPTYEARFEIDRLLREDLTQFAEVRRSMQHLFSLQTYADIMSSFAAGERYVNRVWSASTDGYQQEVNTYIEKALHQFQQATQQFSVACQQRLSS